MARIDIPKGEAPESHRLLALQPAMGHAMAVLATAIYEKSSLDIRLREAIRMRIAQINQCHICLNYRFPDAIDAGVNEAFYEAVSHWHDSNIFNDKEKCVIEYAERFSTAHLDIDNALFTRLNEYFSASEIYEITTTIAGLLANGRILQVLNIEQSCSI